MPNLNETLKIRTEVDNSLADQGLNQLQKKVQNTTGRLTKDFSDAGKKAGDQMGREIETRMNKSMRLVGQTFSRYFGEWGRMFGEVFQIGKDVSEILPRRRGQSGGHGGGSMAGVIAADVGSDVGQTVQTAVAANTISKTIDDKRIFLSGPQAAKQRHNPKFNGTKQNGNGVGAGINGAAAGAGVGMLGGFGSMAIGLGFGALIGGLGYLIAKHFEYRKEVTQLAKAFNLTNGEAEKFVDIGRKIGNEQGVTQYLSTLNKLLEDAKQGSKAATEALRELGVASAFVSEGKANESILGKIKSADTQVEKDKIALRAGMTLETADEFTGNTARGMFVNPASGMSSMVNRKFTEKEIADRKIAAEKLMLADKNRLEGAKALDAAGQQILDLYKAQIDDADEIVETVKYELESLKRQEEVTNDLVELGKLRVEIAKKQVELDNAKLKSDQQFFEMMDQENAKHDAGEAKKAEDQAFFKEMDEVNDAENAKGQYLIDREGMNATAYEAGTYNTATKPFTGTDENMVAKSLMGKHKNAVGDPTKFNIAGKRQSKLDNYMKRQGFMDMPFNNDGNSVRYIPLGNGKFLPVSQAMRSHTDNIRGTKNLNESGINPTSLLEIMNRNGGALPTKVIIQ
jgi:hypothetical protein